MNKIDIIKKDIAQIESMNLKPEIVYMSEEDADNIVKAENEKYQPGKGGSLTGPQIALINDDPNRQEVVIPSDWLQQSSGPIILHDMITGRPRMKPGKIGIGVTTHNR